MPTPDPQFAPSSIEIAQGSRWQVARIRSRCEKPATAFCHSLDDIAVYLPLRRSVHRYKFTKRINYVPLFPGYLFIRCSLEQQLQLRIQCSAICGIIETDDRSEIGLVQDLNDLRKLELNQTTGEMVTLPHLVPGSPVAITTGPFRGTRGVIQQRRGKQRICVNIDLIGQSVALEVDADELELDQE